ncbi:MAG: hypothetical protein IKQ33_06645 [Clostridia bacterium]|nr:hypothetical protein [Clostridia bacterium]
MIHPLFIIGAIILAILGVIYVACWVDWEDSRRPSRPRLTFEEFKSYYNVNPDKWILSGAYYYVEYRFNKWDPPQTIDFKTFKDYIKYDKWLTRHLEKKNENTQLKCETAVLKDIEKDIKERMEKEVKKDGNF